MPEVASDALGVTLEFALPIITPIGIQVFLFVQLARLRASEGYERGKLDIAVNEVERMKLTVSQILEISRIEDTEPRWDFEPVDIKELINDTVSRYF